MYFSVTLVTDIEVRSGHGSGSGSGSGSVLCLALERGGDDRLLLSGGLDGRVCLYRLDTPPPPAREGDAGHVGTRGHIKGDTRRRERTVIRALASSPPPRGRGAGRAEGHDGAVSSVQW